MALPPFRPLPPKNLSSARSPFRRIARYAVKSTKHSFVSPPNLPLPPYHPTQGMGNNDTLDHKCPRKALRCPSFVFHLRFISNECNGKNDPKREKATLTAKNIKKMTVNSSFRLKNHKKFNYYAHCDPPLIEQDSIQNGKYYH